MTIYFEVNGRRTDINGIRNSLERAMYEQVKKHIAGRLKGIVDPATGEAPNIVVHGNSLEKLTFKVEGSPELIERVQQAFKD